MAAKQLRLVAESNEHALGGQVLRRINSSLLVESDPKENEAQFCASLEKILLEIYGSKPEWLEFSAGGRFAYRGGNYREFVCLAGSVSLRLMQRAEQNGGLPRALIYCTNIDGLTSAYEIRGGRERGIRPDDIRHV